MLYKKLMEEYGTIQSTIDSFKEKLINEIQVLFKQRSKQGKILCFNFLKHKIDGPLRYFRIFERDGKLFLSDSVHCDEEFSTVIKDYNMKELKFIYEILYHQLYYFESE